ncbi:MAG: pyrroline-5-carboxylate reductase [Cyclobacteriaceae bacterium]
MKEKIAILGGGNLGASIAEGLIQNGFIRPKNIMVTRRKLKLLEHLKKKGVQVVADNCKAISTADIIIIAVKPKQCAEILEEIKPEIKTKQILVSVVTGVTTDQILETIGKKTTVFRVMPNTAIAIQESMSCISSVHANKTQINAVSKLFASLGKVAMIDEELMNASTALGACGIAFALRFIRAATQGGIEIGFDSRTAELIAAQTVKGAASLLLQRGRHPEREIDLVTTPQGCTIAGLNEMEHQGFSSSLIKGIVTSFNKI